MVLTICKETASFLRAMNDAGVTDPSLIYFVDDSALNIDAAQVKKKEKKKVDLSRLHTDLLLEIGMDNGSCCFRCIQIKSW